MRLHSPTVAVGLVAAGALLAYLTLGLKPPIQDRWLCLTQQHKWEPQGDIWLRVPKVQRSQLVDHVKRFARQERLWFAVDFYPAGAATIPHERIVIDACSRPIAIHLNNTHRPNLFSIFAVRHPAVSVEQAGPVFDRFVAGLDAKWERATPSEISEAHN